MRKLQQDLNHVAETRCWNLKLNPAKCMVKRFGERVDDNCEKHQIFGESLKFVTVYKDLGTYVVVKLRFNKHLSLVVGRAISMIEMHSVSLYSVHGFSLGLARSPIARVR